MITPQMEHFLNKRWFKTLVNGNEEQTTTLAGALDRMKKCILNGCETFVITDDRTGGCLMNYYLPDYALEDVDQVAVAEQLARKHLRDVHRCREGRTYGTAYDHAQRVASRLAEKGESAEVVAAGWLHDMVEDSFMTVEELRKANVSEGVIELVELLTHSALFSYQYYINKLADNPGARRIKIQDILANLNDAPTPRRVRKYAISLRTLMEGELRDQDSKEAESCA